MSDRSPKPQSFTDNVRPRVAGVLQPIGRGLLRLGISADAITLAGTLLMAVVGALLANGQFLIGGVLVILSAPLDALDGTVARLAGVTSKFGAFLDSTSDRYAEGFILIGLLIYGLTRRGAGLRLQSRPVDAVRALHFDHRHAADGLDFAGSHRAGGPDARDGAAAHHLRAECDAVRFVKVWHLSASAFVPSAAIIGT